MELDSDHWADEMKNLVVTGREEELKKLGKQGEELKKWWHDLIIGIYQVYDFFQLISISLFAAQYLRNHTVKPFFPALIFHTYKCCIHMVSKLYAVSIIF